VLDERADTYTHIALGQKCTILAVNSHNCGSAGSSSNSSSGSSNGGGSNGGGDSNGGVLLFASGKNIIWILGLALCAFDVLG
jgi:hypothetical protein